MIIKAHISPCKDTGKRIIAVEEKSLVKAKVWSNTVKWQLQQEAILTKAEALIHGTNSCQRYSRQRQGPKSQHDVIQKRGKRWDNTGGQEVRYQGLRRSAQNRKQKSRNNKKQEL